MQRYENGVLICSDELLLQAVAAFRHLTVQRCTKQSRLWILWELIPLNFCNIHFQKWPASWHWSRESRAPALRQGKLNVGGWSAYRKPIVICIYIYMLIPNFPTAQPPVISSPLSCHCRAQKTDIHGWAHDTASFNQRFLQHGWQKVMVGNVLECDAPLQPIHGQVCDTMGSYGILWDSMGNGMGNGMGLGYPLWDMFAWIFQIPTRNTTRAAAKNWNKDGFFMFIRDHGYHVSEIHIDSWRAFWFFYDFHFPTINQPLSSFQWFINIIYQ